MRTRKFFWCSKDYKKHPIEELAVELKHKGCWSERLCKSCFDDGYRLRLQPSVYQISATTPDK